MLKSMDRLKNMVHRIDQSRTESGEANSITDVFVETEPGIIEFKGGIKRRLSYKEL